MTHILALSVPKKAIVIFTWKQASLTIIPLKDIILIFSSQALLNLCKLCFLIKYVYINKIITLKITMFSLLEYHLITFLGQKLDSQTVLMMTISCTVYF